MADIVNNGSDWRRSPVRILMWAGAAGLLLLPLIAMQFTGEVNWDAADFIVMGAMLAIACGSLDLLARMRNDWTYRIAAALAVGAGFLLIWVNLAVGFLGDEDNAANLLFGGVLAVAVLGSIIARGRPARMAQTMFAAAALQALIGVTALVAGLGSSGWMGTYEAVMGTSLFGGLWLLSGWLFSRSAAKDSRNSGEK